MSFIVSLITVICIFGILSVSLGLITGHLGIFSMAHAALFGLGAYTYAFLTVRLEVNVALAVVAAMVVAAVGGAIMAIPSLRVSGDYFLVASFALQIIATSLFENWSGVTGGTAGIPGILRPEIGPLSFVTDIDFMIICLIVVGLVTFLSWFAMRSPYGRMMHVIRDDETVAATMGKPIASTKMTVVMVSAAFAGIAGVLYGQYLMYISPASFEVHVSVTIVTMIVVGGMNNVWGTLAGSAIILLIPEGLRLTRMPADVAGPMQQVFFGALLVLLMFVRPQGLFGERTSSMTGRKSKSRKPIAKSQDKIKEPSHVA